MKKNMIKQVLKHDFSDNPEYAMFNELFGKETVFYVDKNFIIPERTKEDEIRYYENKGMKFIEDNADDVSTCCIMENVWSNVYRMYGWATTWISKEPIIGWYKVTINDVFGDHE